MLADTLRHSLFCLQRAHADGLTANRGGHPAVVGWRRKDCRTDFIHQASPHPRARIWLHRPCEDGCWGGISFDSLYMAWRACQMMLKEPFLQNRLRPKSARPVDGRFKPRFIAGDPRTGPSAGAGVIAIWGRRSALPGRIRLPLSPAYMRLSNNAAGCAGANIPCQQRQTYISVRPLPRSVFARTYTAQTQTHPTLHNQNPDEKATRRPASFSANRVIRSCADQKGHLKRRWRKYTFSRPAGQKAR